MGRGGANGRYLPAIVELDLDVDALSLLLRLADQPPAPGDAIPPGPLATLERRRLTIGTAPTARGVIAAARFLPRPLPAPPPRAEPAGVAPATMAVPRDAPLELVPGAALHLVVAAGPAPGAARLVAAWAEAGRPAPLELLHDGGVDRETRALAGDPDRVPRAVHEALAERLATARTGLRLYLAGTEAAVRSAAVVARAAGVLPGELQSEPDGTGRRVRCVACRAVTDGVTGRRTTCSACGLPLRVRDHFSRRHGAYLGFPDGLEARSIGDHT